MTASLFAIRRPGAGVTLKHRMRPFGWEIATEIWDTIWSWKIWLSCHVMPHKMIKYRKHHDLLSVSRESLRSLLGFDPPEIETGSSKPGLAWPYTSLLSAYFRSDLRPPSPEMMVGNGNHPQYGLTLLKLSRPYCIYIIMMIIIVITIITMMIIMINIMQWVVTFQHLTTCSYLTWSLRGAVASTA